MSEELTSVTSPIIVNFFSELIVPLLGRIGATFAPGKRDGRWRRDLEADLARLRDEYRTDVLVSLMEQHEYERFGMSKMFERATFHNIEIVWFPIRDVSVPKSMEETVKLVNRLVADAHHGRTVVIHCRGGIGRTGLIAASCLVALGRAPDDAIQQIRALRPRSVETREQEEFVSKFARRWKEPLTR
jgi:protein-tyrosine phosphatase